jgi:hypothetical protein
MAEEDRGFWGNLFGRRDDAPRDIPVDFFSLPMDANPEKDEVVGEGDFGPVYQTVRGQRYQIRPTSTERSYESEPGTLDRVAEVGRGAIEDTIDGAISGVTAPARAARGEDMTYGDAFETAGTAQAGGAASPVPEGSVRSMGLRSSDGFAETPAQIVARLLREDRGQEVTDDLMAQVDPQEMYRLYEAGETGVDLPMDEASRVARAREMGFDTDAFHATTADFQAFDPMRRGSATDAGWFGDADYFSPSSSYAERFVSFPAENPSVIPARLNRGNVYDWRAMETERGGMGLGNNAGAALETRARLESEGFNSVEVSNPIIKTDAPISDEMWSAMIAADPSIERFGRENISKSFQGGHSRRSLEDYFSSEMLDLLPTQKVIDEIATFSPTQVRSRFARFDPRLSHLSNLSAANRDATTGIMATQAGSDAPTPRDFGFTRDNPGGDWLRNKQERADQSMAESSRGLGRRGITGSVTGTMGMFQDMFLPTDRLSGLTGLMDERRVPGDSNFDALMARVREEGFDPNQDGNKIVIAVNHRGEPFVLEGNTRIAVARELGVPNVRVEVRYWNGAEQVDGPFAPNNVAQIAAPEPLPAAQPQEFNRGGLVLSDATKGIRTREGMEMANKKFQLDRSKADQDGDGDVSKLEEIQGEAAQRTVGKDDLVEMACGGIMMPDMELDPVSGNEVPLGSTPENVRDDIPAMLSQDEYVLPAHVVKWHGLKHIQEMQMEAEAGLMSMSMEGLIGGVEEAAEEADEDDTMEDEYIEDMDVEVDVPTVEVEDELEGEEYEEEPQTSTLPGMMKKQKYAFIIS